MITLLHIAYGCLVTKTDGNVLPLGILYPCITIKGGKKVDFLEKKAVNTNIQNVSETRNFLLNENVSLYRVWRPGRVLAMEVRSIRPLELIFR